MNKKELIILVTGAAGFIGAALCKKLLSENISVIGIDNLNSYYDPRLKKMRLKNIQSDNQEVRNLWKFYEGSIENYSFLENVCNENKPNVIVNLAAQAGVRNSLNNPFDYVQSNLVGFCNVLELSRHHSVMNLIYASSSSVYGGNKSLPYHEHQNVDHPISLYAATKRSNELMAHSYSHLYNIPITGLRFFTVYGPWGRPDMAPMLFAKSIVNNEKMIVYNNGKMSRDFTYIDDVVEAIWRCCNKPAISEKNFNYLNPDPSISFAPHKIFNVGYGSSINLLEFISILEKELGNKAEKIFMPVQDGDVIDTHADNKDLKSWINFAPKTSIKYGIKIFAKWFLEFYEGNTKIF